MPTKGASVSKPDYEVEYQPKHTRWSVYEWEGPRKFLFLKETEQGCIPKRLLPLFREAKKKPDTKLPFAIESIDEYRHLFEKNTHRNHQEWLDSEACAQQRRESGAAGMRAYQALVDKGVPSEEAAQRAHGDLHQVLQEMDKKPPEKPKQSTLLAALTGRREVWQQLSLFA